MCTLSLYDVIGITRHLHIKLKSFSNIAQPLHKEAVRRCSFSFIIAKKSVIMSEAFIVDVSICSQHLFIDKTNLAFSTYIQASLQTVWIQISQLKKLADHDLHCLPYNVCCFT